MRTRNLAITTPIMDAGCQRIRREICRVGSPATQAELRAVVQSYRRYVANGGSVPVMLDGSDDSRDVAGSVVNLGLIGDRLMATVQSCGRHDIKSARQSPRWTATIAEDFKDGQGNLYPLFMLRLNVQSTSPSSPQQSNNLSLLSKENRMSRNYSLVKKHIMPSRREWMLKNAPRQRVRSLSIASDTTAEGVSLPDFVRYWNLLISASGDPSVQDFEIKSTPATAAELETMLATFEGIIRKRVQLADDNKFDPNQNSQDTFGKPEGVTLQDMSLQQRSRNLALKVAHDLANKCRDRLPFGRLNEQDQDARMRKFWGK